MSDEETRNGYFLLFKITFATFVVPMLKILSYTNTCLLWMLISNVTDSNCNLMVLATEEVTSGSNL